MVKRAESASERLKLAREAHVLRLAAHPGTVELLATMGSDPPEGLELRALAGGTAASLRSVPFEVAAGIGAALATIVADLHQLGVFHHDIRPEHVLFDEGGRPVLCGFGSAVHIPNRSPSRRDSEQGRLIRGDVDALRSLITGLVESREAGRLERLMSGRFGWRHPSARALARRLIDRCPGARLPGAPAANPVRPRPRSVPLGLRRFAPARPRLALMAGVITVVSIGALVWTELAPDLMRPTRSASSLPGPGAVRGPCPAVDLGCLPLVPWGGMIDVDDTRYLLDAFPGPALVVVGRWQRGATGLPAVLDVGDGRVWVFWRWPGRGRVGSARLAATVPSASSVAVWPSRSGCDQLEIGRTRGPILFFRPRP